MVDRGIDTLLIQKEQDHGSLCKCNNIKSVSRDFLKIQSEKIMANDNAVYTGTIEVIGPI